MFLLGVIRKEEEDEEKEDGITNLNAGVLLPLFKPFLTSMFHH